MGKKQISQVMTASFRERAGPQTGDLVKYTDRPEDAAGRHTGLVLRLDVYHPDSCERSQPIIEVLWDSTGLPGWILTQRVSALCE